MIILHSERELPKKNNRNQHVSNPKFVREREREREITVDCARRRVRVELRMIEMCE